MTFKDLEGQNYIAYDASGPNMSMHAKNQVNRYSGSMTMTMTIKRDRDRDIRNIGQRGPQEEKFLEGGKRQRIKR